MARANQSITIKPPARARARTATSRDGEATVASAPALPVVSPGRDTPQPVQAKVVRPTRTAIGGLWDRTRVAGGAVTLTLACFLVLPLLQVIARPPSAQLGLRTVDTTSLPPPPPPPEPEPPPPPEAEPEPPELTEEAPPLDLSQLELALNPGLSGDWLAGDFHVDLNTATGAGAADESWFDLADLDQKPRALYQSSPQLDNKLRRKAPGTVYIIFVVDEQGHVVDPVIQSATDPIFERPALNAVKQWRFEPGKRGGQPVRFRMRVPITFPKGS